MSVSRWSRRQLLKSSLLTAASLPLTRALGGVARAQSAAELNFVGIYYPHGICAEYWAQREGESASQFDIRYENCTLQPFDDPASFGKSFKDKLIIIEGLDLLSNIGAHTSAGTIFTGSRITDNGPQNASLEQVLAVEHRLGLQSPVTSVALGVGHHASAAGHALSYGVGGAALPMLNDPLQAFDLLFGNLVVVDDPSQRAAVERERKRGKSILDFIRGELAELQPKLGANERLKLDQHVSSVRDLEKRLVRYVAPAGCKIPARPDMARFPKLIESDGGNPYFDAITDAQLDLLANALACGVTRFATLALNDLSYEGNPLGLPADNHGRVAHTYNASTIGFNGEPTEGEPESWLPLAKLNRYSYSKIARFMQRLDQLGVLDNTLIYVSSDMGNPSIHSTLNVPTLLCGGAGGKLKMGRRIRLGQDCSDGLPPCAPGDGRYKGVANNHLLVSIAQLFGVPIDNFGTQLEAQHSHGALSELA